MRHALILALAASLAAPQALAQRTVGEADPTMRALGTSPQAEFPPERQEELAELQAEVQEWQDKVNAYMRHEGADHLVLNAYRALHLQYELLLQTSGAEYETVRGRYDAARDRLANAWDAAGGDEVAGTR